MDDLFPRIGICLFLLSAVSSLSGCGAPGVTKLEKYDPATAASKAIEIYDKNDDGKLSADELKASLALAAAGRRVDLNGDKQLTREEIRTRMEALDSQSDYIGLDVLITLKGKQLVGAVLTLSPEPFLGNGFPTFTGTINDGGGCPLQSDGKELPGIPTGFYQAKIVSTEKGITVSRGVEIADDTTGNRLEVSL
jgi:hypothetical protein